MEVRIFVVTAERQAHMQHTQWNVITGAPSSGKTAVANELSRRGYRVVPEVARAIIDKELAEGKTLSQIKSDIHAFERSILIEKVRIEAELPLDQVIFLDRAVPDSIAYYILEQLDPAEAEAETCKVKYKQVFIFERLRFTRDKVRSEDERRAQRIDGLLRQAYEGLGYPVCRVPVLPLDERVEWVLERL